ncbi:MAG: porin family protein [Chlamydiales bacterium]
MKKFTLKFIVAMMGLTWGSVSAQDYCCYPPVCSHYDASCEPGLFNGFYIGGNLGVLTNIFRRNDQDGFLTDNSGWSMTDTDIAGGLQAGVDCQRGNTVVGIVGDWNPTNVSTLLKDNPNENVGDKHIRSDFDWYSTIRARAGLAICDTFIYLTGGAAVARFDTRWKDQPAKLRHHNARWGWTAGVGTEFRLCGCFTFGGEFLFMHFDDNKKSFYDDNSSNRYTFGHNDSAYTGRLVINYRL